MVVILVEVQEPEFEGKKIKFELSEFELTE